MNRVARIGTIAFVFILSAFVYWVAVLIEQHSRTGSERYCPLLTFVFILAANLFRVRRRGNLDGALVFQAAGCIAILSSLLNAETLKPVLISAGRHERLIFSQDAFLFAAVLSTAINVAYGIGNSAKGEWRHVAYMAGFAILQVFVFIFAGPIFSPGLEIARTTAISAAVVAQLPADARREPLPPLTQL